MFTLSKKSEARLKGVHPTLVGVVLRALQLADQDFMVLEGLRSMQTQQDYMRRGATRTLASKHLLQPTGYGHAVDLVPVVRGVPRFEWPLIYPVAAAMQAAAAEQRIPIRWGGVWDRRLSELLPGNAGMKQAVAEYCVRHPGPDFIDGPHYELI